jgi:hypothetical protein
MKNRRLFVLCLYLLGITAVFWGCNNPLEKILHAPSIYVIIDSVRIDSDGVINLGVVTPNESREIKIIIKNEGNADLILTDENVISFTGEDAAFFSLEESLETRIAPGHSITGTIICLPTSVEESFYAQILIGNNDDKIGAFGVYINGSSKLTGDTTAPTIGITSTVGNVTATAPVPFTLTFSEPVFALEQTDITVEVDSGSYVIDELSYNSSRDVYTLKITPESEPVTITVSVPAGVATDSAGNPNTAAPGSASILYDTSLLTVDSVTSNITSPTKVSAVQLTIIFSQQVTGFTSEDISLGSGWTVTNLNTTGNPSFVAEIEPGSEGLVTVDIPEGAANAVVTGRGNQPSQQYSFTYDVTAPGAPVIFGTTPTKETTPSWTWSSGGGGNGIYRYKLNNSDLSSGSTIITDTGYTSPSELAVGEHSLYVQERDEAGNWSESGSIAITIDRTSPSPPSTPALAGEDDTGASDSDGITKNDTGLTFSGAAESDSTVELTSSQDGSLGTVKASATGEWSLDVSLSADETTTHNITATATDEAGNISPGSVAASILIDRTAPDDFAGVESSIDLGEATLTWTDPAGTDFIDISWNPPDGAGSDSVTTGTGTYTATGLTNGQAYSFYFAARDSAGNSGNQFTLPVLLPNVYELSVLAGTGGSIAMPAASPVTVFENTAIQIESTPANGYSFESWTITSGTAVFADDESTATTVTIQGGIAEVTATFTLNTYELTVSSGTVGSITEPSSSPVTVNHGAVTTISAEADTSYIFDSWEVTFGTADIADIDSQTTTVTLEDGAATVTALWTPIECAVTINNPSMPEFSMFPNTFVLETGGGTTVQGISAIPGTGVSITSYEWFVNGTFRGSDESISLDTAANPAWFQLGVNTLTLVVVIDTLPYSNSFYFTVEQN